METVQRFARHLGLSRGVTPHFSMCRHSSSRRLYQHRWECNHHRCSDRGHSVSNPSVTKIMDFFLFLCTEKRLFVATIRGYCLTLSSVFKFRLLGLQDDFVLRDLVHSVELKHPLCPVSPPAWDLVKVFSFLRGPTFESLSSRPLRVVTMKVLFLLSLATAK